MEPILTFRRPDDQLYDVPASEQDAVLSDLQAAGTQVVPTEPWQDDAGNKYDIPPAETAAFTTEMHAAGRKVERLRVIRAQVAGADGVAQQTLEIPDSKRDEFLRDYHTAPDFAPDRDAFRQSAADQSRAASYLGQQQALAGISAQGAAATKAAYAGKPVQGVARDIGMGLWNAISTEPAKGILGALKAMGIQGEGFSPEGGIQSLSEKQAEGQGQTSTSEIATMAGGMAGGIGQIAVNAPVGIGLIAASALGNAQQTYDQQRAMGKSDAAARAWAIDRFAIETLPMVIATKFGMGSAYKSIAAAAAKKLPAPLIAAYGKAAMKQVARELAVWGATGAVQSGGEAIRLQASGENTEVDPFSEAAKGFVSGAIGAAPFAAHHAVQIVRSSRPPKIEGLTFGGIQSGKNLEGEVSPDKAVFTETTTKDTFDTTDISRRNLLSERDRIRQKWAPETPETPAAPEVPPEVPEPGGPDAIAKALQSLGIGIPGEALGTQAELSARRFAGREIRPNRDERRDVLEEGQNAPAVLPEAMDPNSYENIQRLAQYVSATQKIDMKRAIGKVTSIAEEARRQLLQRMEVSGFTPELDMKLVPRRPPTPQPPRLPSMDEYRAMGWPEPMPLGIESGNLEGNASRTMRSLSAKGRYEDEIRKIEQELADEDARVNSTPPDEAPAAEPAMHAVKKQLTTPRWEAVTPQGGMRVGGNLDVVDADTILTSDKPGYPQDLQNRTRSTKSSQEQIEKIASKPDSSLLQHTDPMTDGGAPIVLPDDVAINNGRILALRLAYSRGTADTYQEGSAIPYRAYAENTAKKLGIDASAMKEPIVIRRLDAMSHPDAVRLAELSNRNRVLQMTAAEQAVNDSAAIQRANLLDGYYPDTDGNIRAASNREFLAGFIEATGDQSLRTADGGYDPSIDMRVKRAILHTLLGDAPEARDMTRLLTENSDTLGVQRQVNGVLVAARDLLSVQRQRPTYDLLPILAKGMKRLLQWRQETEGKMPIEQWKGQGDLFVDDSQAARMTDELVVELGNARSVQQVQELLRYYAKLANQTIPEDENLFAVEAANAQRDELLRRAIQESKRGQPQQAELGSPAARSADKEPAGPVDLQRGADGGNPRAEGPAAAGDRSPAPAAPRPDADRVPGAGGDLRQEPVPVDDAAAREARKALGLPEKPNPANQPGGKLDNAGAYDVDAEQAFGDLGNLLGGVGKVKSMGGSNRSQPRRGAVGELVQPQQAKDPVEVGARAIASAFRGQEPTLQQVQELLRAKFGGQADGLAQQIHARAVQMIRDGNHDLDVALRQQGALKAEGTITAPQDATRRRQDLRIAGGASMPTPPDAVPKGKYNIDEDQRLGVNMALWRFLEKKGKGFLLADGTGVGKTSQLLTLAHEYAARTGKKVLIISQNYQVFRGSFVSDAKRLGFDLSGMDLATYNGISNPNEMKIYKNVLEGKKSVPMGDGRYGLVIFDEAHNLKNDDAVKTQMAQRLAINADHTLFATATPMDRPVSALYFMSEVTGKPRAEMADMLGFQIMRVKAPDGTVVERAVPKEGVDYKQIYENLKILREVGVRHGAIMRREYPFLGDFENKTLATPAEVKATESRIVAYYDAVGQKIPKNNQLLYARWMGQKTLTLNNWLEQHKVEHALKLARESIAAGRSPVVVTEYVEESERLTRPEIRLVERNGKMVEYWFDKVKQQAWDRYIGQQTIGVQGAADTIAKALEADGHEVARVFGGGDKAVAIDDFQGGRAKAMVMTVTSGGTGVNADDVVGNRPRDMILLGFSFAGDSLQQVLGRISRRNTASRGKATFLWTDSLADVNRRRIIESKVKTLQHVQQGEDLDAAQWKENMAGVSMDGQVIANMGGKGNPRPSSPAVAPQASNAQKQVRNAEQMDKLQQFGGKQDWDAVIVATRAKSFIGLRKLMAPQSLDEAARVTAGALRAMMGRERTQILRANETLKSYQKAFDHTPVSRTWTYKQGEPLPPNYETMRAIDSGDMRNLTDVEKRFAGTMRGVLDEAIAAVQSVNPHALRDLYENYFPRIWKETDNKKAAVASMMSKKPLEGSKDFMKQRILEYFTDGLKEGLIPVSDNPVDMTMMKVGEMYRYAEARRFEGNMRAMGLRKFVYFFEPKPEGWRTVDDPSSNVWTPPIVKIKEAFDGMLRARVGEILQAMGIPHERVVSLKGTRWGEAHWPGGNIKTKFAGPENVIWHELGHQVEWRYKLWDNVVANAIGYGKKGEPTSKASQQMRGELMRELRALADLRYEGQEPTAKFKEYVRDRDEQMANMLMAYVYAPEKMRGVAPNTYKGLDSFLNTDPLLKRIKTLKPSLVLDTATAEKRLGGMIKLGDWYSPESAAQVVDNYLSPGLGRYPTFRNLRDIAGLGNSMQLLGLFHGQYVINDTAYSGIGLAIHDVLTGRPVRGATELASALTGVSTVQNWLVGRRVNRALANPETATELDRQRASMLSAINLMPGHGQHREVSRMWMRAMREVRQSPNSGAAWESLWRTPFAAAELAMKPVMEWLVPKMKTGIYVRMAERIIADNPNAKPDEIRKMLGKAADATEDRLGQVTYDNLFQHRVIKDAMQLALRAYGWQFTKYRMGLGGAKDWANYARDLATGKKPELTYRMTYLPGMVIGHAILGAIITYAMTGKTPNDLYDYLFPDSGLQDAKGRPVRLAIADFMKDYVSDWRNFPSLRKMGQSFTHKLGPMWNLAAEMYQDKDFFGTEIFSARDLEDPTWQHVMQNIKEGAEHTAKSLLPFSVRAQERLEQFGAKKLAYGPWLGLVPAPRYATLTPAEMLADEIQRATRQGGGRTKDAAEHSKALAQLMSDWHRANQDMAPAISLEGRGLRPNDLKNMTRKLSLTPLQYAVWGMQIPNAIQVWHAANTEERQELKPVMMRLVSNAIKNQGASEKLASYATYFINWKPEEPTEEAPTSIAPR